MDPRYRFLSLVICTTLFALGCSGSGPAPQAGTSEVVDTRPPEAVTTEFLEAVRTGDDKKTANLLTPSARAKTADQELVVAPPGSETATFAIRECMLVEDNGARVSCDWTDLGADGQMHTDRIVWLLRQVPTGWRIAGMATKVFSDRPPVVLNFEDPEDMMKQQEWVSQEMARREKVGAPAASSNTATEVR
ncbi:MAG: hypothetical protein WD845_08940 [Pirellulales bacterium]